MAPVPSRSGRANAPARGSRRLQANAGMAALRKNGIDATAARVAEVEPTGIGASPQTTTLLLTHPRFLGASEVR